ncbi:MAG: SDR family NAD(P)-dependent oxidoreductase [Planctomycetota bacterium]
MAAACRVLVTGGGRGIGRAIALRFARAGARVAVAARTAGEVERVAREIDAAGGEGLALTLDVTDLDSVQRGLATALAAFDETLDVLVNNAGVFSIQPFAELSPATWYRTLAINLTGPFHVTLLALRGLERSARAHIFNINSVAGRQAFPGNAAYCASKYGLRGLTDVLRLDLAAAKIRVSSVYPAATDTPIWDAIPGEWPRAVMNRPEDVAEVLWNAWQAPRETDVSDLDVPRPGATRA